MMSCGICARAPAEAEGLDHFQHDGQRPGLQRLRREGPDAADGPGRARRNQALEATGETKNLRYEELLMEHVYLHRVPRMPADEWPEPFTRSLSHLNQSIYVPMQGPGEHGASGKLKHWDRSADHVPTLVIRAEHDTMDRPTWKRWPISCPMVGTTTAPTAVTSPTSTTSRLTSRSSCASSTTSTNTAEPATRLHPCRFPCSPRTYMIRFAVHGL